MPGSRPKCGATLGELQVLVNNAGLMIRENVDSPRVHDAVRRLMEVNYFGTFNALHGVPAGLAQRHAAA